MKLTHTQRFPDTVYNFITTVFFYLNYIHTEINLSLDQLIVSKYSALITYYMFTHEEFRFHRCPFHFSGTLLSIYPSIKVQ
jgi:hypothetical protein